MRSQHIYFLLIALTGSLLLTACANIPRVFDQPDDVAQRIAAPAWMIPRTIPADPFELTAYERMHTRGAPANIYIEGDGKAWLSKHKISGDPTPTNPVALHLAAYDKSENIAWLARPCQYTKLIDDTKLCHNSYWTNKRFAPEVLESYNAALDNIAAKYDITEFNIIGFSGGANIAAILAAERSDVVSLRTVAGNLDHVAHSNYHRVSILQGSLNAVDYADKLRKIPQHHFIGGQDNVVPSAIIQSYLQAVGEGQCIKYSFVQEAGHESGWVNKWPELLRIPMSCKLKTPSIKHDYSPIKPYTPPRIIQREAPVKP